MLVERDGDLTRLVLGRVELGFLMRALERASFIDTPVSEQGDIVAFCSRALEILKGTPSKR